MKKGCIKKLLSVFLVALIIISMVPITSVPVNAATTPASVDDATVKTRFDKLRSALVGKYFTVNQTYCISSPGEAGHPPENDCSNCYNANVIKTNWLKNCIDLIPDDIELTPGHYAPSGSITNNAWSCAGFANFVEWYLYAQKSTDDVYVKKLGNASVSYNGLKSIGAKIGNVLRSSGGHSVVLYGYDSDSLSYIQCNGTRTSDGNCKVTFYDCSYSTFSDSFGSTVAVTQAVNSTHTHNYLTEYEAAHPHKQYKKCYGCGDYSYTGVTRRVDSCSSCLEHTCSYLTEYEAAHPHKQYMKCYDCGDYSYTGITRVVESCSYCNETFTITYNANEGIGAPTSQTKLYGQTLILNSSIPIRSGYIFLGWVTDVNATIAEYAPGDEFTLNENITLYALWSLDHTHNHAYEIIQPATCTEKGMGKYTCECGDEYTEEIPATGHQNTMWITEQEPDCTMSGYKDEWCLDCGEIINTEIIPANGHSGDEWTVDVEPNCTDDGSKHKLCTVCNEVVTEVIPAKGHTHSTEWTVDVAPTCEGEGSKSHHCTVCGDKADVTVIEPLGHIYSTEWTIDVAPTCTEEGSKSHHCTGCDEMVADVTVIEPLGHNYKLVSVAEEHPHTNTFKCSRCTDTKTESSYSDKCGICNFSYTDVDSATCRITGYIGGKNSFVIPATINGKTVSTTTTGAFKNNTTLTSVKIENSVEGLGALAFLGCTSLSKIVIPESVSSIGQNAFYNCASDFTIYCYRDTYAMQYAIDNSFNYIVMDVGETTNSTIDYTKELIFTSKDCATNLDDIIYVPTNSVAFAEASLISGNYEYLGTGTKITVFENNDISSEYTLIVSGDTNGDSVCDVLDCVDVQKASSGFKQLEGAYLKAGDADDNGEIDVTDYQSIVNSALAS